MLSLYYRKSVIEYKEKYLLSQHYKYWSSIRDYRRCRNCKKLHGQIYEINEIPDPPPLHDNCRCRIERLKAMFAGTATDKKLAGADWWIMKFHHLPSYYISKEEAINSRWNSKLGNLYRVAPGKMLAKGEYANRNRHLPSAEGRVWYEADINYVRGWRNDQRILYSNDGPVFVAYDHYQTFIEIIPREDNR